MIDYNKFKWISEISSIWFSSVNGELLMHSRHLPSGGYQIKSDEDIDNAFNEIITSVLKAYEGNFKESAREIEELIDKQERYNQRIDQAKKLLGSIE